MPRTRRFALHVGLCWPQHVLAQARTEQAVLKVAVPVVHVPRHFATERVGPDRLKCGRRVGIIYHATRRAKVAKVEVCINSGHNTAVRAVVDSMGTPLRPHRQAHL